MSQPPRGPDPSRKPPADEDFDWPPEDDGDALAEFPAEMPEPGGRIGRDLVADDQAWDFPPDVTPAAAAPYAAGHLEPLLDDEPLWQNPEATADATAPQVAQTASHAPDTRAVENARTDDGTNDVLPAMKNQVAPSINLPGAAASSWFGTPDGETPAAADGRRGAASPLRDTPVAEMTHAGAASRYDLAQRARRDQRRATLRVAAVIVGVAGAAALGYLAGSRGWNTSVPSLSVESDPPGLRVLVDGTFVGQTPLAIDVQPGSRALEVQSLGATRRHTLTFARGDRVRLYVSFESAPAASPSSLASPPAPGSPARGASAPAPRPGNSTNAAGRADNANAATRPAASVARAAPAAPAGGQIDVTSDPPGLPVMIAGVRRGVTPLTVDGLSAGLHDVQLTLGARGILRKVLVVEGQTSRLEVSARE